MLSPVIKFSPVSFYIVEYIALFCMQIKRLTEYEIYQTASL
nr:MAG TPA: hypothetical protein [Caudoviricetes sp.]